MVTWRAWGIPVRCGAGMVVLQTLLALYRFGDSTALLQLVNPLMWIGLGLFFVTGWLIGWVVERLLRGTTGRFRTLLLGATILATPVAVAGSLVGGLCCVLCAKALEQKERSWHKVACRSRPTHKGVTP